jgi:hypothetical protein
MAKNEWNRAALERRLEILHSELESGKKMLAELDAKRRSLTETMLRIEGAIELGRELVAVAPELGLVGAAGKDG